MIHWGTDSLGNLVNFQTGKLNSNAATQTGPYPFFTCSQDIFRTDTWAFDCECVLLGGNNANAIYPLKYFKGKFNAYQRTYIIRPKITASLDTKYLFYALQLKLELMKNISTGATTKFLTLSILNTIDICRPPIHTQRKIAAILSAYDDLIENNTRRIKILEEMAQSIYREWFVNFRFPGREKVRMVDSKLDKIPEGWGIFRCSDIATYVNGYAFKPSDWSGEGVPIIKIKELKEGVSLQTPRYTGSGLPGKYKIEIGDILFSWSADLAIYLWTDCVGWLNQHLFNVLPVEGISKSFILYCLDDQMEHLRTKTTGTTMKHIKRSALDEVSVVLPSKNIRDIFDEVVQPMIELIINIKHKLMNLRQTRDLLLPRLISGELDVSDLDIAINGEEGVKL